MGVKKQIEKLYFGGYFMIIVMDPKANEDAIRKVSQVVEGLGLKPHLSMGESHIIIGVVGDASILDSNKLLRFDGVSKVVKVEEPFKKANRLFKPSDTIVDVLGNKIGGGHIGIMAGPCSVESEEQIIQIAKSVKKSGANFLRGGAFKPRTSPYSCARSRFQVDAKALNAGR